MSSTSSSGSSTAGSTSTSASTASTTAGAAATADASRAAALTAYRRKYIEHRSSENRLKTLRLENVQLSKDFKKTEDDLIAIQSVGQIIGEVLKSLDTTTPAEGGIGLTDTNSGSAPLSTDERVIVKASSGPRYVVGKRSKLTSGRATNTKKSTTTTTSTKGGGGSAKNNNKNNPNVLVAGSRVSLDMTTLTIMRILPREVDPMVFGMIADSNSGNSISYNDIGGLSDEIRELREVIELPLTNPELFKRVGITPPKGVLLYGPPGTGKTLLARALASNIKASYLRVVASAIVDKYIGESARIIREMFEYARSHAPCVIFMDEIDAIGGRRFSAGTSADREIQRTLMELLNQIDGFDTLVNVKIVMATNRPDTLDPALTRPGRLDRKIEIPLPSLDNRTDILMIHATPLTKHGQVDYQHISRMCEGFNGADLRNVCTEAGMFAIRQERPYVQQEDFVKAARKIQETKKLEGKLEYEKI